MRENSMYWIGRLYFYEVKSQSRISKIQSRVTPIHETKMKNSTSKVVLPYETIVNITEMID